MNNAAFAKIGLNKEVWDALNEIRLERCEDWSAVNKEELLKLVMTKTRGHIGPEFVQNIINNLQESGNE